MNIQQKMKRSKTALLMLTLSGVALNTSGVQAQNSRVFPTDLTNVAAAANGGRILASSSTFNDDKAFDAANLIDGKTYSASNIAESSNGWVSNKYDSVAMESVVIGFADNAQKRIGKIVLNPDTSVSPERWAKDVEVQVSTTSAQGPFRVASQLTVKRADEPQEFLILPVDARFVKLVFRSNWGSDRAVALGEVEIYESIRTDNAVGQVIARLEGAINDLKRFKAIQNELNGATTSTQVSAQMSPMNVETLKLVATETAKTDTSSTRTTEANGRAVNIAAASNGGRVADVSSTFNNDATFGASNLIDGQNFNLTSGEGSVGWASEGFSSGKQSVTIGFKDDRTRLVSKIVINPVSKQNSLRWGTRVEVQATNGSASDGPFRTITTLNIRLEAVNQDFEVRPFEAKYVRFVFTANGPGNPLPQGDPNVSSDRAVSLGEIEIYEPSLSGSDLDPLIGRFNQVLLDLKLLAAEDKIGNAE